MATVQTEIRAFNGGVAQSVQCLSCEVNDTGFRFLQGQEGFLFTETVQTCFVAFYSIHPVSLSGVKRTGREVDHPLPSSAEVKNEWSYASTPPICLHGVNSVKSYL